MVHRQKINLILHMWLDLQKPTIMSHLGQLDFTGPANSHTYNYTTHALHKNYTISRLPAFGNHQILKLPDSIQDPFSPFVLSAFRRPWFWMNSPNFLTPNWFIGRFTKLQSRQFLSFTVVAIFSFKFSTFHDDKLSCSGSIIIQYDLTACSSAHDTLYSLLTRCDLARLPQPSWLKSDHLCLLTFD